MEIYGTDDKGDNFSYILTVGSQYTGKSSNINDVLYYVKATNKNYWVLVPEYEVLDLIQSGYDYFLR